MDLKELGKKVSNRIAHELFSNSQKNLINLKAVDTGFLLRSGEIEEFNDGWQIVYSAPYSSEINDGTIPHLVSLKVLIKWVKRKFSYSEKKAYPIALAIQKKIMNKGTKPRPFMDKAIADIKIKYNLK